METLKVLNPSPNEIVYTLDYTQESDINAQIDKANQAFLSLRKVAAHDSSRLLWAWSSLIKQHTTELARLVTLEGGKPLNEPQGETASRVR
ncbi:aldehyde dehydrogenase family protein [Staphylococcus hyicus]